MKKAIISVLFVLSFFSTVTAQEDTTYAQITIIDSYITPELPHKFVLSFFTSDSCFSSVKIENKYSFKVSEKPTDTHKIEIDLSPLKFDSLLLHYTITAANKSNKQYTQSFEVVLSDESMLVKNRNLNLFNVCCIGGVIFGLPSPTIIFSGDNTYFALSKEIPLFSFYFSGYSAPSSYIGVEYRYIPKFDAKNQISIGYKQIFYPRLIEFISPGVNYFNNFLGGSGVSFEATAGLFKFNDTFTLFIRYRFNQFLGDDKSHFHEISIGLYSSFFSLNL